MTDSNRPAGGLDGLIDQVTNFWKITTRSARQMLDGRYSFGDAAQDLDSLISSASGYAVRVADDLWGPDPPLAAYDGTWEATMHVFDEITQRPLTLRTSGLRAIGAADVRIPPSNVSFDPPVLDEDDTKFKITVVMDPSHRRQTWIFRGQVVAEQTGEPVTDTILANNRDDGPVR